MGTVALLSDCVHIWMKLRVGIAVLRPSVSFCRFVEERNLAERVLVLSRTWHTIPLQYGTQSCVVASTYDPMADLLEAGGLLMRLSQSRWTGISLQSCWW